MLGIGAASKVPDPARRLVPRRPSRHFRTEQARAAARAAEFACTGDIG
jgi:hypothetical protein